MNTAQRRVKAGLHVEPNDGFDVWSKKGIPSNPDVEKVIKHFSEALKNRPKSDASKSHSSETVVTVPSVGRFVAADHFKHGDTVDGVRCDFDSDFQDRFLGKIEEDVAGCEIYVFRVLRGSRGVQIRTEVGSKICAREEPVETKLAHLWVMLKLQSKGESGILVTMGSPNFFYIRDTKGLLLEVMVIWRDDFNTWSLYSQCYRL